MVNENDKNLLIQLRTGLEFVLIRDIIKFDSFFAYHNKAAKRDDSIYLLLVTAMAKIWPATTYGGWLISMVG